MFTLGYDVTTIAEEARAKINVFYDRSTNIGYKSTSVAKPMRGFRGFKPPNPPLVYAPGMYQIKPDKFDDLNKLM